MFTSSGTKFQILNVDQFVEYLPRVGPDSGATVIQISLINFPAVNTAKPKALCEFPGYETNSSIANVTAVNLDAKTITCTTPPLSSSQVAISNGRITLNETFAIAKVRIIMLDRRTVYTLNFVYMRNVSLTNFVPENVWFHAPDTSRKVLVFGHNFLPLTESIVCQLQFQNATKTFAGVFVNNYTIQCNVPPPPVYPDTTAFSVPLSVSFNNG